MSPLLVNDIAREVSLILPCLANLDYPVDNANPTGESSLTGTGGDLLLRVLQRKPGSTGSTEYTASRAPSSPSRRKISASSTAQRSGLDVQYKLHLATF